MHIAVGGRPFTRVRILIVIVAATAVIIIIATITFYSPLKDTRVSRDA